MVAANVKLGVGIYSPAEAGFYARVRTQTINRWVFGDRRNEPVVRAQIPNCEEKTITFIDFVQTLAIRSIRYQYKAASLQKIRKAVDFAINEFGITHPLARPHKTYILSEGSQAGEIVLEIDSHLIQATGRKKRQHLIGPIAELYLEQIVWDDQKNPIEYCAWSGKAGDIRMNPHRRFGEPIVESCGYTAETLWEAAITEGGLDAAADAYGVEKAQVALACAYFDHLVSVSE